MDAWQMALASVEDPSLLLFCKLILNSEEFVWLMVGSMISDWEKAEENHHQIS